MVVTAGRGDLDSDCRDSIMQLDKSSDASRVSEARLSGISVNKFEDRLSDRRLLATGPRLLADMDVRELSASERYFSRCHFEAGKMFMPSRFEALSLR
jgi:hypothetical protein